MKKREASEKQKICKVCGALFTQGDTSCGEHGDTLRHIDDPLLGQTVGSYLLVDRLGRGGSGTVYLGRQTTIGSRVAIKVLSPEAAEQPAQIERFLNEARAVNRIEHPNIVRILDMSKLPDGRPYVLMEYLQGATLKQRLEDGPRLRLDELRRVILQILDALEAAHRAGFVHRDLKPENVLVTRQGEVRLLDFGIAKLLERPDQASITEAGTILGTPKYLAPEQAAGRTEQVGPWTDLYSLGVILYEIYAGSLPFECNTVYDALTAHIHEDPPSPREKNSLIPQSLEALILQCLEKVPKDRPGSAQEIAERFVAAHRELADGLTETLAEGAQPAEHVLGSTMLDARTGSSTASSYQSSQRSLTSGPQATWRSASGEKVSSSDPLQPTERSSSLHGRLFKLGIPIGVAVLLLALGGVWLGLTTRKERSGSKPPAERADPSSNAPKGRLVILQRKSAQSLDPIEVDRTESINVLANVFEPLITFDPLTGKHRPWLASSWKAMPTGYTFDIRPKVEFSDGTPLTAKRVASSLKRSFGSELGKTYFWDVRRVEATGPLSVAITLSRPSGSFLTRLSLWCAFITKPSTSHPLGTGPFEVASRNRQLGVITLKARTSYWGKTPKSEQLIFRSTPSPEARASLLVQGDAQVATAIDPVTGARLQEKGELRVLKTATNVGVYLLFNTKKPYLSDPETRRSLAEGVDRRRLLEELYGSSGKLASSSLPPVFPTARSVRATEPTSFEPEKARRKLARTPVAKKTLTLYLPSEPQSSVPAPRKMASVMVEGFKRAGVTVRPVFLTSDELYEACRRGEHDMVVFGWIPDYPDPENIYVILSRQGKAAGYNLALYEDEAFNDLLEKARRELQPHRREKLFAEIEQRLEQKQPWLPLVFVSSFVAIRNDVKGVRLGIEQCLGGADLFLRQAHLKNPSD